MTRKVLILFSVFAVFLVLSINAQYALKTTSEQLAGDLAVMDQAVLNNDWVDAGKAFDSLSNRWNKVEKTWGLITDHEEIDEIALSMEKARGFLAQKEQASLKAELNSLTYLFKHIPEKETLTLLTLF